MSLAAGECREKGGREDPARNEVSDDGAPEKEFGRAYCAAIAFRHFPSYYASVR